MNTDTPDNVQQAVDVISGFLAGCQKFSGGWGTNFTFVQNGSGFDPSVVKAVELIHRTIEQKMAETSEVGYYTSMSFQLTADLSATIGGSNNTILPLYRETELNFQRNIAVHHKDGWSVLILICNCNELLYGSETGEVYDDISYWIQKG